jgi:hypothetical protein
MADDSRPGPLALSIMARATVNQMRDDAAELAALVAGLNRPLPVLPLDPAQREAALTILLLRERDRARRLLALVANVG